MISYFKRVIKFFIQSIDDFITALALTGDALTHYERGFEYQKKGKYEDAISCFTRAIKLNPDYYSALRQRSFANSMLASAYSELASAYSELAATEGGNYKTIKGYADTLRLNNSGCGVVQQYFFANSRIANKYSRIANKHVRLSVVDNERLEQIRKKYFEVLKYVRNNRSGAKHAR